MTLYYKNQKGDVYAYESEEEKDSFGSPDMTPMNQGEVDAYLAGFEPGVYVPDRVTMRQARLALLSAGRLDDAEAAVAALEGDAGRAARIEWEYSQEVWRNKPFVQSVAAALNLTSAQLDELFISAASIE